MANNFKDISLSEELKNVPVEKQHSAYSYLLMRKSRAMKQPLSITMELTPRCNLNCKMCYVHEIGQNVSELEPAVWINLLDQAYDMGVLSVTFTGGEAVLYHGFKQIYQYAYNKGFEISLMTNGTMMDDELLEMFVSSPPRYICMTLYGMSEETYEKACLNGHAFKRAMHSINEMQKKGLPILLQHTATLDTIEDAPAIAEFAHDRNIPFRLGHSLQSGRGCNSECLTGIEIPADQILEMKKRISARQGLEYKEPELVSFPEDKETISIGMQCGAGNNTFSINWKGMATPCILFESIAEDTLKLPLAVCWERISKAADQVKQISECQTCKYYNRCLHCVAAHYNDTLEYGKVSDRLCYKKLHGLF